MNRKARQADVRTLCVFRVHPRGCSIVIATRADDASSIRIVDSRSPMAFSRADVRAAADAANADRIVGIFPGKETICRASLLPRSTRTHDQDDEALASSLGILAEAELPASLASHRRTGGVVPDVERADSIGVLFSGWNSSQPGPQDGITWISIPAALAMLRGSRPWALWADPETGETCLLASGPEKLVARCTVDEPHADGTSWRETLLEIVHETAHAADADPPAGDIGPGITIDSAAQAALRRRVSGMSDADTWLHEHGLCVGAALAVLSERASYRAHATLTSAEPPIQRSLPAAMIEWLSKPGRGWAVTAAACLLLFAGPFALAWGRAQILSSKSAKLEGLKGGREELERRGALYAQLDQSRLPMTKIIADVSGVAPVGVSIESFRLAPGQGLSMNGSATSRELVSTFHAQLIATKLLTDVSLGRVESKPGEGAGVKFDLSAKIASPHIPVKPLEDFVQQPLAVRLFGPGATNKAVAPAPERSAARRTRPTREDAESSSGDRRADGSRRPSSSQSTEPPKPLSDDDITKMDRNSAMKEFAARRRYVNSNNALDKSTKDRIEGEIAKLQEQMRKGAGGST